MPSPESAFWHAAGKGDVDTVQRLLVEGVAVDAADGNGATALIIAALMERTNVVAFLLDMEGHVALRHAAAQFEEGAEEVAPPSLSALQSSSQSLSSRSLQSADPAPQTPNVDAQDGMGRSALHVACIKGNADIVSLLLGAGASVDLVDNGLLSPLFYAAEKGQLAVARVLISPYGADVNLRNKFGESPLHVCAFWNQPETLKLLLSKGADVNSENNSGRRAASFAERRNHTAIVDMLANPELHTEVGRALAAAGLAQYSRALWDSGCKALSDCSSLSEDTLSQVGVTSAGHRKKLLHLHEKRPSWRLSVSLARLLGSGP